MEKTNDERKFCVYRHVFPNKKCYIGITCQEPNDRWRNGSGYLVKNLDGTYKQPKIANAINKYKWENITHEILFDNLIFDDAKRIEQICIILFRTMDSRFGYNMTAGGEGSIGRYHTEETKKKMSEAKKGKFTGTNNPMYGNHKFAGKNNPMYGKSHSEENKKN